MTDKPHRSILDFDPAPELAPGDDFTDFDPAPDTGELDIAPFTPVPMRARRDGWTPERQRAFIAALEQLGHVRAAAAAVGMSAKSAYALRARPDAGSFAAAWDLAVEMGYDNAMGAAIGRAVHGELVPVYRLGVKIGERRRYNDRLLMAAIRSGNPRYRNMGPRSPLRPPGAARDKKRT